MSEKLLELLSCLYDPRDKLKNEIKKHCEKYPVNAHELLLPIIDGIQQNKRAVEKLRNDRIYNGILYILNYILTSTDFNKSSTNIKKDKELKTRRIISIFEIMFYLFPDGTTEGSSTEMIRLLDIFKKDIVYVNFFEKNKNWILNIKGEEYYNWF